MNRKRVDNIIKMTDKIIQIEKDLAALQDLSLSIVMWKDGDPFPKVRFDDRVRKLCVEILKEDLRIANIQLDRM